LGEASTLDAVGVHATHATDGGVALLAEATHFRVYLTHTATATTCFSWFVVG
jgi:hypothetical protein